jgi:hypothetical protein
MMAFVRSVTVLEISLKIDGQGLPPKVVRRYSRARSSLPRPLVVMHLWLTMPTGPTTAPREVFESEDW